MTRTKAIRIMHMLQAAKQFSQSDMALNLGISERTYRNYLTDPAKMDASTWWKIEAMAVKENIIKGE